MSLAESMIKDYLCCASSQDHIVQNPFIQCCGKYACEECLNKIESDSFYCHPCSTTHTKLRIPLSSFVNGLLNENRNALNKLIDKKNYNGKYIYYIATYVTHDHDLFNCSDKQIEKTWFKSLKEIFPDFTNFMFYFLCFYDV